MSPHTFSGKQYLRILFARFSITTAVAVSSGGIGAFIGMLFGGPWYAYFVFASFIPIAPTVIYYSLLSTLRSELRKLEAIYEEELITEAQFKMLRKEAVENYRQMRFGQSELPEDPPL